MVDFSLTPENVLVRDAARAFADAEIVPHIRDWDRSGEGYPRDVLDKMAALGVSPSQVRAAIAANLAIGVQGNRDLFMNAINWLAQQENLIAVRPRQPEDHRLTLTADQQNSIMILSIFIIPGLVFAAGVYTWWRRR